jgi:hypothetical protein
VVRLNVGGVVYVTTAATLRSRGENFFTGLLDRSREWATHDGDGALFVDRNGHHFGPVLDFLRTGRLVVPPGMDRSAVEAECNFYLIELPADARPQHLDKWDTCVLQWRVQTRGVCDTRHTTHDTRHTTHDTRHTTHDTRHTTHDTRHTHTEMRVLLEKL